MIAQVIITHLESLGYEVRDTNLSLRSNGLNFPASTSGHLNVRVTTSIGKTTIVCIDEELALVLVLDVRRDQVNHVIHLGTPDAIEHIESVLNDVLGRY